MSFNSGNNPHQHAVERADSLAGVIESLYPQIVEILLSYESHETATDEVTRALKTLKNVNQELDDVEVQCVGSITTFLPLNLPVYSLVLFAIVPSFFSSDVYCRPPVKMRAVLSAIVNLVRLRRLFPHIHFLDLERRRFLEQYVSRSAVTLFTGRFHNAIKVYSEYPERLFIYNGAGINPILIADSADLSFAARKTVEMRVFNSGQDCAGPDAILVSTARSAAFLKALTNELRSVEIGSYRVKSTRVGKLIDERQLNSLANALEDMKHRVVYGGGIDRKRGLVYPTIITDNLNGTTPKYFEFFAPIFYVLTYETESDLEHYFNTEHYLDHAMYVSVFGESEYASRIRNSVILNDKIVNDIEEGSKPYGGFGPKANFVAYGDLRFHRPILISREIARYLNWKNVQKTTS